MIVEVVAVGTELLLGQIVNTNASTIGAALAEKGLDAHYQQVVGDNMGRVVTAISTAIDRSDVVIITGGIGPTQDDLTREALSEATGRAMLFSDDYAARLRTWWERRGRVMPESNLKQAEYPEGAEMIPNPRGTAPGLVLDHADTLIFCVPGVPAEMEHLLRSELLPRIAERAGADSILVSRVLKTWGRSESDVAETLAEIYESSVNPSVAFLASGGEIKVRITAKSETRAVAEDLIAPVESAVRDLLGESIFGSDDDTIESVLFRMLGEQGWTIGTAESMTGGMISARLTDMPGSSKFFAGGVVPYDKRLKQTLLGVDREKVVSSETAEAMADAVRGVLGVDVGLSVTGSAGPEPMEEPPGTFFVGVATPEGVMSRKLTMVGDRERIRVFATGTALHLARLAVSGAWWS